MGKRKDKEKRKLKAALRRHGLRRREIFARFIGSSSPDEPVDALKAVFEKIAAHYRDRMQTRPETIPDRCPCGKKWKNCDHREELLGTQGSA